MATLAEYLEKMTPAEALDFVMGSTRIALNIGKTPAQIIDAAKFNFGDGDFVTALVAGSLFIEGAIKIPGFPLPEEPDELTCPHRGETA